MTVWMTTYESLRHKLNNTYGRTTGIDESIVSTSMSNWLLDFFLVNGHGMKYE